MVSSPSASKMCIKYLLILNHNFLWTNYKTRTSCIWNFLRSWVFEVSKTKLGSTKKQWRIWKGISRPHITTLETGWQPAPSVSKPCLPQGARDASLTSFHSPLLHQATQRWTHLPDVRVRPSAQSALNVRQWTLWAPCCPLSEIWGLFPHVVCQSSCVF